MPTVKGKGRGERKRQRRTEKAKAKGKTEVRKLEIGDWSRMLISSTSPPAPGAQVKPARRK
jgi:hypothetical protein